MTINKLALAVLLLTTALSSCSKFKHSSNGDKIRDDLRFIKYQNTATFYKILASYGKIYTIAGTGKSDVSDGSAWILPDSEDAVPTDVELSRPHHAISDARGNIYIADKGGHAIRAIMFDTNTIKTVAGTNTAGNGTDVATPGINAQLDSPNGVWVKPDGTLFILDLGNSKVRKLATDGTMTTIFTDIEMVHGRGLWVNADENLIYYSSATHLKKWTPAGGVEVVASGFKELGNLVMDPSGKIVVTDRGAGLVYRITDDGPVVIAGNGKKKGGGDGKMALKTALREVRGIWYHPLGGYFLVTHKGNQVWYVDIDKKIYLFLDGKNGVHKGDGDQFNAPGPKISEPRAISIDSRGNIIITEHDNGFIRMIETK